MTKKTPQENHDILYKSSTGHDLPEQAAPPRNDCTRSNCWPAPVSHHNRPPRRSPLLPASSPFRMCDQNSASRWAAGQIRLWIWWKINVSSRSFSTTFIWSTVTASTPQKHPMNTHEHPWAPYEHPWTPMNTHEHPWTPMITHEHPMNTHDHPWTPHENETWKKCLEEGQINPRKDEKWNTKVNRWNYRGIYGPLENWKYHLQSAVWFYVSRTRNGLYIGHKKANKHGAEWNLHSHSIRTSGLKK